MAKYSDTISWLALNLNPHETPSKMSWEDALNEIRWEISVAMIADIFNKSLDDVARDVLKEKGFKNPK